MKIIICSDIHSNFDALCLLKNEIESSDYKIFLGDYVGYNRQVNEVLDYVKTLDNSYFLLGNHDFYLLNGLPENANDRVSEGINYAKKVITNENYEWLKTLPHQLNFEIKNKKFLVQHASPKNPISEYLYPDNPHLTDLFDLNYDYVIFGHTHHPILLEKQGKYILNPGSIGQPRDAEKRTSYIMIEDFLPVLKRI